MGPICPKEAQRRHGATAIRPIMQTIHLLCTVRPTTPADIPGIMALQRRAFPKMPPWMSHQLEEHLRLFPEGQIVALDGAGRVVGSASSLIVQWAAFNDRATWDEITAEGAFTTHDPVRGDTLYGAEIMVDPAARGMGVGSKLYEARKAIARRFNVQAMIAGGRIPGYAAVANELSPEAYVADVVAGRRKDPVLSFQLANGFRVRGIIPSYLADDQASCGYATLIEWVNDAYHEAMPAA
jgi:predicted N-acetyltransferase YhbS